MQVYLLLTAGMSFAIPANHSLTVDLSSVTYVDSDGKDLLKKIHRQGAKLVASGCLTSCIVNEIEHVAQRDERGK